MHPHKSLWFNHTVPHKLIKRSKFKGLHKRRLEKRPEKAFAYHSLSGLFLSALFYCLLSIW
jgi:hypothetical protein